MPTKLPAAVQRQLDDAERIDQEIAGQAPAAPVEPSPPPAEPAPPPAAEPPPAPAEAEENWQQKYLTLQGKYNTEVPALRQQVMDVQEELKKLKAAPPPSTPTPEPAAPAPEPAKLVTDNDVANFGADLVDLIQRAAREVSEPARQKLQEEIDRLRGQIPTLQRDVEVAATVATDVKRGTYYADLAKVVPDFAAINTDQAFLGWLTMQDPLSGETRQELLNKAFAAFDVTRTAAIFNAYKQETGKLPPAATPPAPAPATEGLEAQISPSGSRTPASPTPDDGKKLWSSAEIHDFYTAVTRGDYRGREAEAQQIDAQIDQALAEGRVQA